jgi:hypothetical protein
LAHKRRAASPRKCLPKPSSVVVRSGVVGSAHCDCPARPARAALRRLCPGRGFLRHPFGRARVPARPRRTWSMTGVVRRGRPSSLFLFARAVLSWVVAVTVPLRPLCRAPSPDVVGCAPKSAPVRGGFPAARLVLPPFCLFGARGPAAPCPVPLCAHGFSVLPLRWRGARRAVSAFFLFVGRGSLPHCAPAPFVAGLAWPAWCNLAPRRLWACHVLIREMVPRWGLGAALGLTR